ncbi:anaerobic ribonucleoside-triphosphate reductase [Jeotgalibaca sp. MA1X17-3]|uniref:anaerobic ribonucleoside-triphosphate reductase n=1 Tax=Jeotgalibaca sp. MA1X17-3 TaxID=2908211 RepID=UPI001F2BF5BA|nr:anaerobic ribonucleoside-triphosphate reductase [Jeotgalibaca sp. MA1X17-3]UJF15825.1 anaerobic ribonucleoside-triphosphate reductase [Jeotgalibaca sp. MA1X17-3]
MLQEETIITTQEGHLPTRLQIQKKDGHLEPYQTNKLQRALAKALKSVKPEAEAIQVAKYLAAETEEENYLPVEGILTGFDMDRIVKKVLTAHGYFSAWGMYQEYQARKEAMREKNRDMDSMIQKLLNKDKSIVNENANKDSEVFNTQRDLTAGTVAKAIGMRMLPLQVANAHEKGEIHYHDLDYTPYSPLSNCCLIDFENMFTNGFKIGNADVDSPRSIQTAAAQTAQIIANVASSQYGGCSFDRIDEVLAPYAELNYQKHKAEADKWIEGSERQEEYIMERTKKDIYDAMQSLEYEINTLYTSQGQTPFTSLGFGLGTSWFEREIQKAILAIRIKGLGKEKRTAIFPKLIFTLKKGLNFSPSDPNYDVKQLALECSTKRMYPDILSYDKIVSLTGSFKAPMGCRSFLQGWKDAEGQEVNAGRMNLGVVTLNIPRIALEADGDKDLFWEIFRMRVAVAKEALVYKAKRVEEASPENAPILYQHGAFGKRLIPGDSVKETFKERRATVSIGYIGLYEAAAAFYGGNWEENADAKNFTLEIIQALKSSADEWSDEYGYHFSVYSTPSESLTDRFCQLDTNKFGAITDITDKGYYTNSFHYDVRKNPTPFEKLDFEKDYPQYCSGGFIHYCEYPKLVTNPKALEAVWDYAYDRVGYLGTNTPIDHCYECDFQGDFIPTEKGFKCPQCGNHDPAKCDVVKRTCGYLGNPQQRPMVSGRHKEISSRVKHMKGSE